MADNDPNRGPKKQRSKKVFGKDRKPGSISPPFEEQSSASSSTVQVAQKPQKPQPQPKIQIAKRPESFQPPQVNRIQALVNPKPLMEMKTTGSSWNGEETHNVNARQAEANKLRMEAYYFSDQAGTAASLDAFKDRVQYNMKDFPIERNENILIDRKFNLHISPTTGRVNGLYIRVKSQRGDETVSTGALVHLDANDKTIRDACRETMKNFSQVLTKNTADRVPFSSCSESFLTKCQIKKLEERQDTFPEAIYYCDKCDYHINTISHAKAHLESSAHFDDIERGNQREALLKNVPEPSHAHLTSINNVLKETLQQYQEISKTCEDRKQKILFYLTTQLFKAINCEEVTPRLFGSSTYDVMLPDSDLNIAYTTELPRGTPIFAFLEKVRKQISDDGYPANHLIDMGTSSTIVFTFEDMRVRLCWFSSFAYRSQLYFSTLIQTYISLRPEVVQFLQLIRLWATRAGVDSKNKPRIGLPRYGFDILAIHYLQQVDMLPVLHELYTEEVQERGEDQKTENKPDSQQKPEDVSHLPEEARQRRMRLMSKYQRDINKISPHFDLKKKWNMAKLWMGFFRYYVKHHREVVVQITQKTPMTKDDHRWNKKILHVVDPFRSDNVLSIPKVSTWQPFYFNCLLTTFISFSIPRTRMGPVLEVALYQSKGTSPKKKQPRESFAAQKKAPEMTQITEIPEEVYNTAADEIAEEQENERYVQQLRERLQFDGINLNSLKSEDVEIDEHVNQVYSRRTMKRVQRVLLKRLNEDELKSIACPEILNKRTNKRLKKAEMLKKKQSEEEEDSKADQEVAQITQQIRVCCVTTVVPQAEDIEVKEEEREPTPPVENSWKHWNTSYYTMSPPPQNSASRKEQLIDEPKEEQKGDQKEERKEEQKGEPEEPKEEEGKNPVKRECRETYVAQGGSFVKSSAIVTDRKEVLICTEDFFIRDKVEKSEILRRANSLGIADLHFDYSSELFSGGYEMEMKCTHCDGSHCVDNCPMMEIPPIEKFPPRTPEELKDIDDVIDDYYKNNSLDPGRLQQLEAKVKDLEKHLQTAYRPDVNLTIFGSVMTGLSVGCSDIDICLRFGDGHEPPADKTPKEVIQEVEAALRSCKQAKKVQAIVTAKVPIVKFFIRLDNDETVDVDVSYYNILALYNTKLLKEYTLWTPDNRFAKLALFIKNWAKSCDIGDASRGSLSSYAHTVLLISYLQQCDPPVLPRLQEDFRSENQERRIVENWDTSFVEAEHKLVENWTKNKDTCAQLLLGYLDYYSRFDFRNFVAQCRREMMLSKVEKEWLKPLCVEDPFDLNHNLSAGVTKKMYVFVMKVFIASRAAFMSAKPDFPRDSSFLTNYKQQLFRLCNQGSAPSDRQCHQCHRIGHFIESCPQRAQIKEARRRYGSNSTNSTYRSNGGGVGRGGDLDRITVHKRPFNRRYK